MSLIDRGSEQGRWSAISLNDIRWAALLASLLLTFLAASQNYMPNDDGVLYLLSAEQFAAGEWDKALQLYNWPLYGMLIAAVHLLSGLGVEASAHVLNGLLQAVLVFAFLGVVSELGGDRRIVLIAAVLILVFPSLNEYRSEIIRGHGYWAFTMLGLLFLLRHIQQYESRYASGWVAALAFATLFRIEGLVLLALAPLVFLLDPRDAMVLRAKRFALVYGGYVAVAGLALVVVVYTGIGEGPLRLWERPASISTHFYIAVSSGLSDKVAILQQYFLSPYSDEYAWSIVAATILIILFTEVIASAGLFFGFLVVYTWLHAGAFRNDYPWRVVWFFVAINVLILAAFVVSQGFLTGRYPIALALLLVLFPPFGAVTLYRRLAGSEHGSLLRSKWISATFAFVALILLIDGVYSFSPGKVHVEQAAIWLNEHTRPADRILSLDAPLLYRSGKLGGERYLEYVEQKQGGRSIRDIKELTLGDMLKTMDWRQFDYIAALVSHRVPGQQTNIEKIISSSPIKEFRNRKGDRVLIYATKADAATRVGVGS